MHTERGRGAEVLFPMALAVALSGCGGESESPAGAGGAGQGGTGGGGVGAAGGGGSGGAAPVDVLDKLLALPGVLSVEEGAPKGGARYFAIEIEQPADHDAPEGQSFTQRIGLFHRDFEAPMVLASTGYGLGSAKLREPALLVNGNQLTVEHRFFTPSRPDPADWHHLRIRQAASDHHRIVEAFKEVYPGRWLSTGASKGGMTSVYHRRFFPDDVFGTIAYVAPQSYGDADPRYVTFLEEVGSPECRDALKAFQGEVLSRRPAMTAAMVAELGESGYDHLGVDGALDFAVVELPFAFWQYQDPGLCAAIPGAAATDEEVWGFLNTVDPPQVWGDELFEYYEPYYFQAAVELGYPGYDDSHLAGLLSVPQGFDVAAALVEPGPTKEMVLDEGAMPDVADWLATEGQRMLFVYGELDPYSAAAFDPGGAAESARFFVPGGNHGALISDLGPADQAAAIDLVSAWAGVAKMPPPSPELLEEARERRPPGR
jgi:hypothetical protein